MSVPRHLEALIDKYAYALNTSVSSEPSLKMEELLYQVADVEKWPLLEQLLTLDIAHRLENQYFIDVEEYSSRFGFAREQVRSHVVNQLDQLMDHGSISMTGDFSPPPTDRVIPGGALNPPAPQTPVPPVGPHEIVGKPLIPETELPGHGSPKPADANKSLDDDWMSVSEMEKDQSRYSIQSDEMIDHESKEAWHEGMNALLGGDEPPSQSESKKQAQSFPPLKPLPPLQKAPEPVRKILPQDELQDARVGGMPTSLGRYEIQRVIGKGGFGVVYEGFDKELKRKVAIKVPKAAKDSMQLEKMRQKFTVEAQRLAQLRHHNIVAVHDVGVEGLWCYIVSDFVEGQDLRTWIRRRNQGELSPAEAHWCQVAEILAKVADSLAYAHARQTIHRDVKPANIILSDSLEPVLIDFGIALSTVDSQEDFRRVAGTPAYMSPEQAGGHAHLIDRRTDIYSLGIILYEALSGDVPFYAESQNELFRLIKDIEPKPLRELATGLPAEIESILSRALAKRRENRYGGADEMAADLRAVIRDYERQKRRDTRVTGDSFSRTRSKSSVSTIMERNRGTERRQITVLVLNADITSGGNMETEQALMEDPEIRHEMLGHFWSICGEVAAQMEGAVVQAGEQGVLISFGYPVACEDAGSRAVRTAMDIEKRLSVHMTSPRIQSRYAGAQMSVRAIVNSGTAVVSSGEGMVKLVGEAPAQALRLLGSMQTMGIVMTESTHSLVEGYFKVAEHPPVSIMGAALPQKLYSVQGVAGTSSRVELIDPADLTPMVGRDTELSILKDRWEQAIEGMGQVVLLIGEAGLGKSRLIREIKQFVDETDPEELDGHQPYVVEWRCSPYHSNVGFYPVTEFFQRLFRWEELDDDARLKVIEKHLSELGLKSDLHIGLLAELLSLKLPESMQLGLTPQRRKECSEQLLLDWIMRHAEIAPVLLVIEDLHWMDPSTLNFLSHYMELGHRESVLSVFTFRPDFETPWRSYSHQTQVALNRLTRRQVSQILSHKAGVSKISTDLARQVAERTDGVPLFVEEFSKLLAAQNEAKKSAAEPVDFKSETVVFEENAASSLNTIPATLQDLLAARLERVTHSSDVVQLAATLGREFEYELLNAVSPIKGLDLEAELSKLVRAELLFQKGQPPTARYIFKHALIQDAAYTSMLKSKRQQFHRMIAVTMEESFPDILANQPALLARHYTEADVFDRAVYYWLEAGKRSQSRSENVEAISQLKQGLELLEKMEPAPQRDELELHIRLSLSASLMGVKGYASPEVEEQNKKAIQLCEKLGPGSPLFHVMMVVWAIAFIRGQLQRADSLAKQLRHQAERNDDDGMRTEALWASGCTAWWMGQFARCEKYLERAHKRYNIEVSQLHAQFTQQNSGPLLLCYWGLALWAQGRFSAADEKFKAAGELVKKLNHPFTEAVTLYKPGFMYQLNREPEMAIECADNVLEVSQAQSFAFWTGFALGQKGAAISMQGNHELAIEMLDEAETILKATGCEKNLQNYFAACAEAHWKLGQHEKAWEKLEAASQLNDRDQERYVEAEIHRRRADFLADQKDYLAAENSYRQAIEVSRQQGCLVFELRATLHLSRMWQITNREQEVKGILEPMIAKFKEGFDHQPDLVEAGRLMKELEN